MSTSDRPNRPPSTTLVALARRAKAGDRSALEALVEVLYAPVARFLTGRLTRYPAEVRADATQEAMVCVAAHVGECRGETDGQLLRWVLTVAWHEALRYLRSPAAGIALTLEAVAIDHPATMAEAVARWWTADSAEEGHAIPGDAMLDLNPSASAVADHGTAGPGAVDSESEVFARLAREAYGALAAGAAEILWRRVVEGATYREIARAHGTTVAGAKRRFQRAAETLRRLVLHGVSELPGRSRAAVLRRLRP